MKHTIGRWPVTRYKSLMTAGVTVVACKDRALGSVWRDTSLLPRARRSARRNRWRALHARNNAVVYHRTMHDAIADIVRTETLFPTQEYC